MFVKVPSEYLS